MVHTHFGIEPNADTPDIVFLEDNEVQCKVCYKVITLDETEEMMLFDHGDNETCGDCDEKFICLNCDELIDTQNEEEWDFDPTYKICSECNQ